MPKVSVTHPRGNVKLIFHEGCHLYIDNTDQQYKSVTELVKEYSQDFDAEAVSRHKAERELEHNMIAVSSKEYNEKIEEYAFQLREQWKQKRDTASRYGIRVHKIAEELVKGNNPSLKTPDEHHAFSLIQQMLTTIRKNKQWWIPEPIVFSPQMGLAGTIDLLVYDSEGILTLYDWKTNERITWEGYRKECMKPPMDHLQDANAVHYSLQLALYKHILQQEGYIDFLPGPVQGYEQYMIWIPPKEIGKTEPKPINTTYNSIDKDAHTLLN